MAFEEFDVIIGSLGFATAQIRNQAQTRITNFLGSRQQFRDEEPVFNRVTTKYGGVAGLGITLRMSSRADADAIWADIEANSWSVLQPGSMVLQSNVVFDSAEGTQTVTEIHQRSFPAQPTDF
jgi:hypothetical protein